MTGAKSMEKNGRVRDLLFAKKLGTLTINACRLRPKYSRRSRLSRLLQLLLLVISFLILTAEFRGLRASAASEFSEGKSYPFYQINGDFASDGGDGKQLIYYKYISDFEDIFDWSNLQYMTVNAVSNGHRLRPRILGYRNGEQVFDSGLGNYAVAFNVQGANFDYYLLILAQYDDNNQQVPIGDIDTCCTYFGYSQQVQLPTTPNELVEGVQGIESAIIGGEVETLPPDSDGLPSYRHGQIQKVSFTTAITNYISMFWYTLSAFFTMHSDATAVFTVCIMCAIVGYIIYGR